VFTQFGLRFEPLFSERDHDGRVYGPEWMPGEWSLRVLRNTDSPYSLVIPVAGLEPFRFTSDEYRSGNSVARAVLVRTGTIMLDSNKLLWKKVWEGGYVVQDSVASQNRVIPRSARGLAGKLLDSAHVYAKDLFHGGNHVGSH
jgi:hypothetical protein